MTALSTTALLAQSSKPNIMIVMVDDMGYSDPECFGGEIHTPHIDSLASNGVRMTQFYNCARSCPSRASLMTGLYAQQVGITGMGQSLNNQCVTIPEVLKLNGYSTGMTGKWHLSLTQGRASNDEQMKWLAHQASYGPFAPLPSYPCNRGFDEHYGTIWGVGDFFDPFSLVHNETAIETVPKDFYMTDFVTDHTVQLIDTFSKKDQPFFMYVAYTAPHWPLHALPEDIAKYDGKYDDGWDALSQKRYQRMLELGLITQDQMPVSKNESNRSWNAETRKAYESATMEVHAAMVDRVDQGLGKIIAKLKETGRYDNTIIFFLSDNGASPERYLNSGFDRPSMTRDGTPVLYPGSYPMPGAENTCTGIGDAWAAAVNTPFRYWKSESFHGGTATPMIIQWPAGMKLKEGSINTKIGHVTDIMPTCLELAGAAYPSSYKGNSIIPLESQSMVPVLEGDSTYERNITYWEHEGGRAIRKGNWRLVSLKNANWQLFDMSSDQSETRNVAAEYPDVVKELKTLWNAWAVKMGLNIPIEIDDTPKELSFYYPFDEDLQDKSDNGYVLSGPNGYSFDTGKFNKALKLNGTNQYLDLNTHIYNPQTTQFSVCAWLYNEANYVPPTATLYEQVVLAQKDGSSDAAGRIALYARYDGPNTYFNNFLGANPNLSNKGIFQRNVWQHVAVICNPSTREITYYLNGEKDTTCYAKAAFESCKGGYRIGGHKASKDYWNGKIDELYLFKGLLSSNDVKRIMNDQYFSTTSVSEHTFRNELKFVNDQSAHKLRVSLNSGIRQMQLYSLEGEMLLSSGQPEFPTEKLMKGSYILKVTDMNNATVSRKVFLQ